MTAPDYSLLSNMSDEEVELIVTAFRRVRATTAHRDLLLILDSVILHTASESAREAISNGLSSTDAKTLVDLQNSEVIKGLSLVKNLLATLNEKANEN